MIKGLEIALVFGTIVAFIIQMVIVFFIVRWAAQPQYQIKLLKTQIELLARVAKKHGMSDEEIEEITRQV